VRVPIEGLTPPLQIAARLTRAKRFAVAVRPKDVRLNFSPAVMAAYGHRPPGLVHLPRHGYSMATVTASPPLEA
jgi:hypothetical protein